MPWLCSTLRAVTGHLADTGKPTAALDAMLVCHVAGCSRVTGSASGVPQAGEAGCDERCAALVARFVDAVHGLVRRYAVVGPETTAEVPPPRPSSGAHSRRAPPAAHAFFFVRPEAHADHRGIDAAGPGYRRACRPARSRAPGPVVRPAARCPIPPGAAASPARRGTGSTRSSAAFDGWQGGPAIRSAGCWDRHAWNPRSDHPQGRACDLFATRPGRFAGGAELAEGWRVARWVRGHAEPLQVKYVIWQGRYWDPRVADQDGWGRRYSGAGVYDVRDATGGHYDHVHISFRE